MDRRPRRILFVCIENSCRSQIAEAFARIHGAGVVEAYSAGSHPSGEVNPKAIECMGEVAYDLTGHQSKSLLEVPEAHYDYVITMGCGDSCPRVNCHRVHDQQNDPRTRFGPAQVGRVAPTQF